MKNFLIAIALIVAAVFWAVTMINILRNDDRNAYFNVCNEITNTGSASFTALNNEIHSPTPTVNGSKYYVNSNFAINEITMSGWTTIFDWTKGPWWTGKCYLKNNSGIEIDISDAIYLTASVLEKLPKDEIHSSKVTKPISEKSINEQINDYVQTLSLDQVCKLWLSNIVQNSVYSKKLKVCISPDSDNIYPLRDVYNYAMDNYSKQLIQEEKKNLFWTSALTN